jgi:hypothetical protein
VGSGRTWRSPNRSSRGETMLILPAILFVLSPFVFPPDDQEEERARQAEIPVEVMDVLGEDGSAAIKQAQRITIVPIKAIRSQREELRAFAPAGRVRVLSPRIVVQLKKTLLERSSYRAIALAKLCGKFSPSLQIDFTSDNRQPFQLLVSFGCSEMRVRRHDGTADSSRRMDFAPADERITALLCGTIAPRPCTRGPDPSPRKASR